MALTGHASTSAPRSNVDTANMVIDARIHIQGNTKVVVTTAARRVATLAVPTGASRLQLSLPGHASSSPRRAPACGGTVAHTPTSRLAAISSRARATRATPAPSRTSCPTPRHPNAAQAAPGARTDSHPRGDKVDDLRNAGGLPDGAHNAGGPGAAPVAHGTFATTDGHHIAPALPHEDGSHRVRGDAPAETLDPHPEGVADSSVSVAATDHKAATGDVATTPGTPGSHPGANRSFVTDPLPRSAAHAGADNTAAAAT